MIYDPDKLKPVRYVTIDSREIKKSSLFIAIKGKKFDGHDFVRQAVKKGASAVMISEKKYSKFDDVNVPIITVKNTTRALGDVAKIWRKKLDANVIGITGSSGKTTVKDITAQLLSEKYRVNKTELNNNNHIGVPLTILRTNENHDVLVAELGTNHFGEIPYTAAILSPDIALITNIGDSHLEAFKNRKNVWNEKSSLFNETVNNKGKIILYYDDPIIREYHTKNVNKITFGFDKRTDINCKIKRYSNDGKPVLEFKYPGNKFEIESPLYGGQNAKNLLAAIAIAFESGLNRAHIIKGIKKLKMPKGRLNVFRLKNSLLIDDTYNANPDSTKAAMDLAGKIKSFKRKIIILGDMLELGKKKIKMHEELSKVIAENGIDEVYTIGSLMKYLDLKLSNEKIVHIHFTKRNSLKNFIREFDPANSVILVKGSRGMKMEEFVKIIKEKKL